MGRNTTDEQDGGNPASIHKFRDFTANLGGPIVKDKLWFFGAYQNWLDQSTGAGTTPEFYGNLVNKTFFAKLNWQINPNHKVQVGFANENYSWGESVGPFTAESHKIAMEGNKPTPTFSYTGLLTDATMLEVRYGGYYGDTHFGPADPNQDKFGPYYYNVHGGLCSEGPCEVTGNPSYWYDFLETSASIHANLSHYADDFLGGSHDFKFGVQYLRAGREDAVVGYTDLFYLYEDSAGDDYLSVTDYTPFSYGGLAHNKAVFFDDTFRVNDRLTLKVGARYDWDRASVPELPIVDSFGQPTGPTVAGVNDLYSFTTFSPRLGLTYALTDDGKTIVRAFWGRYSRGIVTMDFAGGPGNLGTTDSGIYTGIYPADCFYTSPPSCVGDGRGTFVAGAAEQRGRPQHLVDVHRPDRARLRARAGHGPRIERDVHAQGGQQPSRVDGRRHVRDVSIHRARDWHPVLDLQRLISEPEARTFLLGNPDFLDTSAHAGIVALNKRMSNSWQAASSVMVAEVQRQARIAIHTKRLGPHGRRCRLEGFRQVPQQLRQPRRPTHRGPAGDLQDAAALRAPEGLPGGGQLHLHHRHALGTRGKSQQRRRRWKGATSCSRRRTVPAVRTTGACLDLRAPVDRQAGRPNKAGAHAADLVQRLQRRRCRALLMGTRVDPSPFRRGFRSASIVRPRLLQLGVKFQF